MCYNVIQRSGRFCTFLLQKCVMHFDLLIYCILAAVSDCSYLQNKGVNAGVKLWAEHVIHLLTFLGIES